MTKLNLLMKNDCKGLDYSSTTLDKHLATISSQGWIIVNDAFLLKFFAPRIKCAKPSMFEDLTRYETFINDIHIDSYVKQNILLQGLLLIDTVLKKWQRSFKVVLAATISSDIYSDELIAQLTVNVKFFLVREKEDYLLDDL